MPLVYVRGKSKDEVTGKEVTLDWNFRDQWWKVRPPIAVLQTQRKAVLRLCLEGCGNPEHKEMVIALGKEPIHTYKDGVECLPDQLTVITREVLEIVSWLSNHFSAKTECRAYPSRVDSGCIITLYLLAPVKVWNSPLCEQVGTRPSDFMADICQQLRTHLADVRLHAASTSLPR